MQAERRARKLQLANNMELVMRDWYERNYPHSARYYGLNPNEVIEAICARLDELEQ